MYLVWAAELSQCVVSPCFMEKPFEPELSFTSQRFTACRGVAQGHSAYWSPPCYTRTEACVGTRAPITVHLWALPSWVILVHSVRKLNTIKHVCTAMQHLTEWSSWMGQYFNQQKKRGQSCSQGAESFCHSLRKMATTASNPSCYFPCSAFLGDGRMRHILIYFIVYFFKG